MSRVLRSLSVSLCVVFLTAPMAQATADGPDFLRVIDVKEESSLNMRAAPMTDAPVIHKIPANTDGLLSFGCVGGLSQEDWQDASDVAREASRKSRWCLVGHDRMLGWSAGWFLGEGRGPDTMNAGERLTDIAGSEWLLRNLAGQPARAEAWIRFDTDGATFGSSGCNRFTGSYAAEAVDLTFGLLAMTRRACPEPETDTETAFMAALGKTHRVAATHLVLSLLGEDNALLATLTRRDAD